MDGKYVALGVALGVAIGVATDNLAIGIAVGLLIGLAIGKAKGLRGGASAAICALGVGRTQHSPTRSGPEGSSRNEIRCGSSRLPPRSAHSHSEAIADTRKRGQPRPARTDGAALPRRLGPRQPPPPSCQRRLASVLTRRRQCGRISAWAPAFR